MHIVFDSIKSLSQIQHQAIVVFVGKEHVTGVTKCNCGDKCKCGDICDCPKNVIQQAVYEYDYKGEPNETAIVSINFKDCRANKVILIGLGEKLTDAEIEDVGFKAFNFLNSHKIKSATCFVNEIIDETGAIKSAKTDNSLLQHLVFGLEMAHYKFDKYLTGDKLKSATRHVKELEFVSKDHKDLEKSLKEQSIIRDNVIYCRNLINEPGNVIYPESFAKIAKETKEFGVSVEILDVKEMKKLGMGSLLAVGQGSDNESKMVILKYNGLKATEKPLAFVGKGVTFDSGGLSIKTGNYMETMKCDMSGAAVVLSLIRLLAMRKAKVNVVGIMPLVENMPSGKAQRVDDIVTSMSGQTIEVINTDAEGRMILADALYYAATKFKPKIIIDLATLTGAICVSLGEKYAGLFTNNDELSKELTEAGNKTGETVWRMPLSKLGGFYDKHIDSDVADVKNAAKRDGGAITAAQFLQRFIDKHPKWAHIDIAATAFVNEYGFLTHKHATGYGVRLLNELIKDNYEQ